MHILYALWAVFAVWRWSDWRNWKEYHATMLYMPLMNLLYFFLCSHYLLWEIQPEFGVSYKLIEVLYTFIIFPSTVLIFLSNFPEEWHRQLVHYLKWILIYIGFELLGSLTGRIDYSHGWNIGWSLVFLCFMFPMIRFHYKKPVLAYTLSVIIIIILLNLFDVPIDANEKEGRSMLKWTFPNIFLIL